MLPSYLRAGLSTCVDGIITLMLPSISWDALVTCVNGSISSLNARIVSHPPDASKFTCVNGYISSLMILVSQGMSVLVSMLLYTLSIHPHAP